jgi:methylamine dehydrogenase accessory protein MauD
MSGAWLASYWVLWMLVLALVFIVVVLARQIGVLHMRMGPTGARAGNPGPAIGALAPELSAADLDGRSVRLGGRSVKRTLLLFVAPKCPACGEVVPSIKALAKSERATLDIYLVSIISDIKKVREFMAKYKIHDIPCIISQEVNSHYGIITAPYAVLISETGIIVSKGIANHVEHLESLLNAAELGHPTMESLMKSQTSVGN